MTPRPALSLVISNPEPMTRHQDGGIAVQKSQTKVFDPYRYRAEFPDLWAGYLRAHFRSPEAVAAAFDVRFQTALNWWQGAHRPSGDKVALAALADPAGFAAAMTPKDRRAA